MTEDIVIAELEDLVREMRTTNITRGLKTNVYNSWCDRIDHAARVLRTDRARMEPAEDPVAMAAGKVKR